jgi:hypothetical protein
MDELIRFGAVLALLGAIACNGKDPVDSDPPAVDDDTDVEDTDVEDTDNTVMAPDYREEGTFDVTKSDATVAIASCEGGMMDVTRYEPNVAGGPVVILAHGPVRSKDHMADVAAHMSSWGLTVWTPQLCHSSLVDTNHQQNASDLVELADTTDQATLFMGHSTGALSAYIAGSLDDDAVAVFAMDMLEWGTLGADAQAAAITTYGLASPTNLCNGNDDGLAFYDDGWRMLGASHCSFESPSDEGCTAICGGPGKPAGMVKGIGALATAFALWQTGEDPLGEQLFIDGNWADAMTASGLVEEL